MGNQSSKGKDGPLESFPSFSRTDTQGSTRSFSSLRKKIKGGGGDQSETNSIHGSFRSERSERGSLRDGTLGVDDDGTPAPQPPPTPPHASTMKGKSSNIPPNGSALAPPAACGDIQHTPNSHPNAALDTLIPVNIEPILIKSPQSDGTSPTGISDQPKTPTFSPSDGALAASHGSMSPFSTLAMNPLAQAGLDEIIQRLLTTAYSAKITRNFCLRTHEITALCHGCPSLSRWILMVAARELFMSQPTLIELTPPVKIVGDVHGQFGDLIRLFEMCGWPPKANYLFLGDYVDRGRQSLETVCLLFALKVRWPENFFLLRGNHECANVTKVYGFYDECKRRTSIKIWRAFIDVFNCLPIAAIVAGKIFCVHGGLSPSLTHMDDIRKISRPTDVPDYGLLNDLLWSDPGDTQADWEDNERGVSYTFGRNVINEFLLRHDFDLVCRAHMVVEDGYEFFNERTLVTVFSAPNYCGEFDNWGAVMSVNEELLCSFELLKPLDASGVKAALRQSRKNGALGVAQAPPAVLAAQSVP